MNNVIKIVLVFESVLWLIDILERQNSFFEYHRGLSDLDGDGRLSCEEFCLALHLADCVKAGDKLPLTLPPDLIPPSFRKKRSPSLSSGKKNTS